MKLFLATNNAHKAGEFARLLAAESVPVTLESAGAAGGMPPVKEDADSFEGNARLKAEALWERLGAGGEGWVVSDDSGLEVDALGGSPGIFSARFAGEDASDADNRRKLLDELRGVPEGSRSARFVCVLALKRDDGEPLFFRGECEGEIAMSEEGRGGFGYDPVFRPGGHSSTFGNLPPEVKNRLSHRGHALRALAEFLRRA